MLRAVGRYAGVGRRAILLGLGRELGRGYRRWADAPAAPAPVAPVPSGPLAKVGHAAWLCGIAAFVLAVLNVHVFLPSGRPVGVFQLAIGTILLVEGLALLLDRLPFRRLLRARLAPRPGRNLRSRLVGAGLTVLGLAWVALGIFNLIRGIGGVI